MTVDFDLSKQLLEAFTPPKRMTISEWADEYRYVDSSTSAYPGKWSTDTAPEFRFIMDSISNPDVEQVSMMVSSQNGKTEVLLNVAMFYMHTDPCPMLILQPTEDMAASFSKERIAPNIKATPVTAKLLDVDKKSPDNNINYKAFPGGYMAIIGTQTPSKLASRPIRLVLADEIDRFAGDSGGEGDPLQLAKKRTANFWNRKVIAVSTPTDEGHSRIEPLYNESAKFRYYVPCHDCGHKQYMKWTQVHWDKTLLDNGKHQHHTDTAHYVCEECGSLWDDVDRLNAISEGEWIAENPDVKHHYGFHLPRFSASMCVRLADVAKEFVESKDIPMKLKVFVNTVLAETWKHGTSSVKPEQLLARREEWDDDVMPENSCYITGAVDVQKDRLELMVIAWGDKDEKWVLEYRKFYGDPIKDWEVWDDMERFLQKKYYSAEFDREFQIEKLVVDSGNWTEHVYKYCYEKPKLIDCPVLAIKGANTDTHPLFKKTVSQKYKADLYMIGVFQGKSMVYQTLPYKDHGAGYWHFSMRQDLEFFEQMTSHKLVLRYHNGFERYIWEKPESVRDEVLDLSVYNIFAVRHSNIDFPTYMEELYAMKGQAPQKRKWKKI